MRNVLSVPLSLQEVWPYLWHTYEMKGTFDAWSQTLYLSLGTQISGIHEDGWWPQALQLTEEQSHSMGFQVGMKSQELDIMQSTVGCLLSHSTVCTEEIWARAHLQ